MKKLIIGLFLCMNLFAAPGVGDSAVDFELSNLYSQSQKVKSDSFKGKVVLLNLWASWCGGCQEEMPLFVKLQEEYSKDKFVIVTSSIDNMPSSAIEFLEMVDKKRVLTALYDANKKLPKAYRCPGMPSSYLIGKDGKIAKIYIGSLDEDGIESLKSEIKALLGK